MIFYKGKDWIIGGISLTLAGFVLAHLSNAGLIDWLYNYQQEAHIVFHIVGPLLMAAGIFKLLLERLNPMR